MFFHLNRSSIAVATLTMALFALAAPARAEELAADLSQLGTMTYGAGNLPPAGASAIGARVVVYDFTKIADQDGTKGWPGFNHAQIICKCACTNTRLAQ